jgi:hypothetical protein
VSADFDHARNYRAKPLVATAAIALVLGLGGCALPGKSPVGNTPNTGSSAGHANQTEAGGAMVPISTPTVARLAKPGAKAKPTSTGASTSRPGSSRGRSSSTTKPGLIPSSAPAPSSKPSSSKPPAPANPSGASCVSSTPNGQCGPYSSYPQISGANSDPWVDQNIWSGNSAYHQTLYASGPGSWYVTANANDGNGGVLTFPNTGFYMTGKVDSSTSITSSYSTTFPHNSQTIGWASYDLWFNNWADEVMIQTDISANSYYDCSAVTTATFAGQPWHMCQFGNERVWKPGTDDDHLRLQSSGTIDVRAFLVWMEQKGYLPASSTWTAGSYGFEVCNTSGVNAKFQVNAFSWKSA